MCELASCTGDGGNTEAVVFDMDGVLVDSEQYWQEHLAERIIPQTVPQEEITLDAVRGLNRHDIYDYLDTHYRTELTREEFDRLYGTMSDYVYREQATLLKNAEEFLSELKNRQQKVAIASSSPREWIDIVVDRFGIRDVFDVIVSAEELSAPGKPDGSIYRHTAAELDCNPKACIAVEDTEHGIQAATAAGYYCIGFSQTRTIEREQVPADVVDNVDDLYSRILSKL